MPNDENNGNNILTDTFNRHHDYLRISLIDKCNLRCRYCMPSDLKTTYSKTQLMSPDEILSIAQIFVNHGVKKIRLTGGEPLVRKDFGEIVEKLSTLPVKLCLTTNGILLDRYFDVMKTTGLRSVNVSLDTLHKERFIHITQRDEFDKIYSNILQLVDEGFQVKVNVVVMKNVNDDELCDFVELTRELPLHIRFIEFMPFDGNAWSQNKVVNYAEMLTAMSEKFDFEKLKDPAHSTSKKFRVKEYKGTFAFITTMSTPFCSDCNRLRITADGKMKNCLFSVNETDLLGPFRAGQDIVPIIQACVLDKKAALGGQYDPTSMINRSMILIGG